jgi:hypothetical protein
MPDYLLQYDLSSNHIEANVHDCSSVYKYLARRLRRRGWAKHQYSCWRCNNKPAGAANNEPNNLANQFEAQYGVGVFLRLEF